MEQYQERVYNERTELTIKLDSLRMFTDSAIFLTLPIEERELFVRQEAAMGEYLCVLNDRTDRWES